MLQKMKRNIIKTVPVLLLALFAMSCTGNYLDINSNHYGATDEELKRDGYDIMMVLKGIASSIVSPDINTAQFTEALLGGPLGGYYADSNPGWAYTISNYNPTDDWSRVLMQSDRVIPTLYSNLWKLQELSDDPVALSIADIMKVCAMSRVTDAYGPVPYTSIGDNANELGKVPYDNQQKIYNTMFKELDAAIAVLADNLDGGIPAIADPTAFGGSPEKWCRFANSMKLRLAMRIVYADPVKAKQMAESAVNHPVGVLTSVADIARTTKIFTNEGNPVYVAVKYNQPSGSSTGGDTHAAADIICYMNGYGDPRRDKYFIQSEWEGIQYVGLRRSIVIPNLGTAGRKYSGVKIVPTDPIVWMNAAEVAFLRAEATAVFGFEMGGTAESFYNEGIRLSMEQWGVSGDYAAYAADATLVPETYTDPAGQDTYNSTLSNLTVKWDDGATTAQKQERIIIQKWIANYHLGNEAWADYRRTGFPKLMPATVAGNKSNGTVDSDKGARRMPYPQIEYTNNNENVQKAVSEYLRGPDNMGTRVWWDCNPATM